MAVAGFDPGLSYTDLVFNGTTLTADVTGAVSQAEITRTIDGASTLTFTVEDPSRVLVSNPIFTQTTLCQIPTGTDETLSFTLVEVEKTGDELTVTFEDSIVNSLRNVTADQQGFFTSTTSTITRADFAAQLIAKTGLPISLYYPADGTPGVTQLAESLQWGTTDDPTEDAWTCLTRIANEVQWRCFSDGFALWFGPDVWLLSLGSQATLQEFVNGVDDIDFDWDTGKTTATATVTCNSSILGFPPGGVVTLTQLGIANGEWLVDTMTRSLFLVDTQVTLTQPQPEISEADAAAVTSGANTADTGASLGAASATTDGVTSGAGGTVAAQKAVAFALAQQGKPYLYGGTGPEAYDCSGLMQAAYKSAGVMIPRTSEAQYQGLPPAPLSSLLPGDLVFTEFGEQLAGLPGHVGMYIGNGTVIEAPHTGTVIHTISYSDFTAGQQVAAARPTS